MSATRSIALLGTALTLLACNGIGSGSSGKLSVSARGQGTPAAASVDLGNGISVSRVRVLVRNLELRGTVSSMGSPAPSPMTSPMTSASTTSRKDDGGEGEDDGSGVEIGPFVVDVSGVNLSGSVTEAFDTSVPDGTYTKLEIAIGPVTGAAAGTPLADMGGSSVIVDGSRAASGATPAADFHVASSLTARQELETSLVVDHAGKSSNVTLLLDLKKWFTASDGRTLDPTVAADRAAIEANIAASLHFEHDDDENGEDDDQGNGSGHD